MDVCVLNETGLTKAPEADRDDSPAAIPAERPIRVEANLLRFPLFALHTKGLRSLDGIRCSGRHQRDGQSVQFTFTATRNTSTLYPGPLARSAHLAFLAILTEAGAPVPHPLTWTWRDLCRRMGIVYGGEIVRDLKRAITATAGLLIQSESALFSKTEGKRMSTREDMLHLYDRVAFVGGTLPDGSESDANYLWLSDWYRRNLDAYFTAPLDFALWKHLDAHSAIASRLYEFLLINFYSDAPALRINYETLTQYLPVKAEKYLSSARRQLGPALDLLQTSGLVGSAEWCASRTGLAQLVLERGERFSIPAPTPAKAIARSPAVDGADAIVVEELRNHRPAEWFLVSDFYRDYAGELLHRPTLKELTLARGLIESHGTTRARAIVAASIKLLRTRWPDAKTFGAITSYLPEAITDCARKERHAERAREETAATQVERAREAERVQEKSALRVLWSTLPDEERQEIRSGVLSRQPRRLEKFPELVERLCLEELTRRKNLGETDGEVQAGRREAEAPVQR